MHSFDITATYDARRGEKLPSLDAIVVEMETAWSAAPLFSTQEKTSDINIYHSSAHNEHSAIVPKGHREFAAAISTSLPPLFDLRDELSYSVSSTPGSATSSPETPGFAPEEWTDITTGHDPSSEEKSGAPFQYFFGASAEAKAAEYLTGPEAAAAWGLAWQPYSREAATTSFSLERVSTAYATGAVQIDDIIIDNSDDIDGAAPSFLSSELCDLSTRDENGWTMPEVHSSCPANDVGDYTLDSALENIWSSSATAADDGRQKNRGSHGSTTPALLTAKHNLVCAVVRTLPACDWPPCGA